MGSVEIVGVMMRHEICLCLGPVFEGSPWVDGAPLGASDGPEVGCCGFASSITFLIKGAAMTPFDVLIVTFCLGLNVILAYGLFSSN